MLPEAASQRLTTNTYSFYDKKKKENDTQAVKLRMFVGFISLQAERRSMSGSHL